MEYELCKKLKEVGFPQEPFWQVDVNAWGGSWYYFFMPEACAQMAFLEPDGYKIATGEHGHGHPVVKIPSLEELIEACGKGFQNLNRFDDEWMTNFMEDENHEGDSKGETSTIAVANLWLKLQEK